MRLRALSFGGALDVSAPELLGVYSIIEFRKIVRAGDLFSIPDKWYDDRSIPNINNAVSLGLLEIVSRDAPAGGSGGGTGDTETMDIFPLMGA